MISDKNFVIIKYTGYDSFPYKEMELTSLNKKFTAYS